MGSNFYSSSYASLQTLNPIGHTSLVSSQHFGTVPDMPFADPVISSPNTVLRMSYNPSTVLYYGTPLNPPTLDDLGGFGRSGSLTRGSNYSSSYASQTQNLNDHTLHPPVSSQHTVADSDNAEPGMLTYDISSHQWQNFFIPQPPPSQSQLLASQSYSIPAQNHPSSPLFICHWLRNDTRCGLVGTVEELKRHCQLSHLPECRDAWIRCRWDGCDYHKRGDPSVHVMRRGCIWRHIHEVPSRSSEEYLGIVLHHH